MRQGRLRFALTGALIVFIGLVAPLRSTTRAFQGAAPAPQGPPPTDDQIRSETESLVRAWGDAGWFSGAVLVSRGDRVVYRGAAGLASPEFGVRNTPETAFRLVSITQMFTAALVLKLQDEGKLNVHDPVGKYMTDWPDAFKTITIEQLLVGAAGVKDVTQIPEFVKSVAVPKSPQDLVNTILAQPVASPPVVTRAPNSHYHLLAALIAKVTGLSYADAIQKQIAEPLGLTRTVHESAAKVTGNRAEGLTRSGDTFSHAATFDMDNALGMADLLGCVDDVHRFVRALIGGRLISPAALKAMTSNHMPPAPTPASGSASAPSAGSGPGAAPPAPQLPGIGYGVGLPTGSLAQWTSGGAINGANTSLVYLPATDTTVVVLSNVFGAPEVGVISRAIATSVLAGKPVYRPIRRSAVTPRPEDLAAIAGTWEVAGSIVITPTSRGPLQLTVRTENGRIFVKGSLSTEAEWRSHGPGQFFSPTSDVRIVLPADASGKPQYITFGGPSTLTRVPTSRP